MSTSASSSTSPSSSSSPSSSPSSSSTAKAAYVWHEKFAWHDSGLESCAPYVQPHGSSESAESKRRFHNLIQIAPDISASDRLLTDSLVQVKPRYATDEEILRIHTPRYLAQVKEVSAKPIGGQVGHEMHLSRGGFEIASLSAGGVLAVTEQILGGGGSNSNCNSNTNINNDNKNTSTTPYTRAYCLVRPPGHHAEADQGHGFCCFSNISIAAAHALANGLGGVKKVAVVDWDVHHGNGTETQFYTRSDLLFISLHQDKLYPLNTGDMESVGEGEGKGYNLNIPLPPGCGFGAYHYAFETIVLPALYAYKPDIIYVSSGFDCSFLDPLGRMMLTSENFKSMTSMLCKAADELCQGRLIISHEGGYSEVYVPFCGLAVVAELAGVETGVQDPFIKDVGSPEYQKLQPHQKSVIDAAAKNLRIALLP